MSIITNALHCKQSTYQLIRIANLSKKVHDSTTRQWLCDKIISRHILSDSTPEQGKIVNYALAKLGDSRRV